MPNLSGKNRFPIDALLVLRTGAEAAITADTDLAVQKLVSNGAVWQNPADVRDGRVSIVGKTGAFTGTTPGLSFDIMLATDAAKTGAKLFASFPVDQNGTVEIDFDQVAALKRLAAATHWFVRLKVSGTTPSLAGVSAYMAPASSI